MAHQLIDGRLILPLSVLLLVGAACSGPSGQAPAGTQPEAMTVERDITYGSGTFNLPHPSAGLSDLSSYQATLILSFDGTHDAQAENWSKTYVMAQQKEPALRQLTVESTGDLASLDRVFMAEAQGAAYERIGSSTCNATQIQAGRSLSERMGPASFLNYVIGADEAGSETINDIATSHYTFDERGIGEGDVTHSSGEMWVATEGGSVVKYVLSTQGGADYFGEGIEGTLSFDYELTGVNQPVEINLPEDCPSGLVDAPTLPDALNVVKMPAIMSYETKSSVNDAAAFYQQELPKSGWESLVEPSITDTAALLTFARENETMAVIIAVEESTTTVRISLGRTQQ
jgi:hypothetical protein